MWSWILFLLYTFVVSVARVRRKGAECKEEGGGVEGGRETLVLCYAKCHERPSSYHVIEIFIGSVLWSIAVLESYNI
jgi:hypothetical protein